MKHILVLAVLGGVIWLVVRARAARAPAPATAEPRSYEPRRAVGPKTELAIVRMAKRLSVIAIKIALVVVCLWLLVRLGIPTALFTGHIARTLFQGVEEFHRL